MLLKTGRLFVRILPGALLALSTCPISAVYASTTPTAPANITVKPYNTGADISWNPVSGIQAYDVFENNQPKPVVSYAWGDHATLTNLTPDTPYTIRVAPIDSNGNVGEKSAPISFSTTLNPPTIKSESVNGTNVTLRWAQDSGMGYNIYVNGVKQNTSPLNADQYTVKHLAYGHTYQFNLTQVDSKRESAQSSPGYATILPAPTQVKATGGRNQVTLSWAPVSNASGYLVHCEYIKLPPNVSSGNLSTNGWLNQKPIQGTSYVVNNLVDGATYFFSVRAVDKYGNFYAPSNSVEGKPYSPTSLSAPAGFIAHSGTNSVMLNWDPVQGSELDGYNVYENGQKVNSRPIRNSQYTVQSLTNGKTYSFSVSSVTTSGVESKQTTPIDCTPVQIPSNFRAVFVGNEAKTMWKPDSEANIAGYNVYQNAATGWRKLNSQLIHGTSYTVTGLKSAMYYHLFVTAVTNKGKESGMSNIVNGSAGAPIPPLHLTATPGKGQVTLRWTASQTASTYNVFENGTKIGSQVNGTTFVARNVKNSGPYKFYVTAENADGMSAPSSVVTASLPKPSVSVYGFTDHATSSSSVLPVRVPASNDEYVHLWLNGTYQHGFYSGGWERYKLRLSSGRNIISAQVVDKGDSLKSRVEHKYITYSTTASAPTVAIAGIHNNSTVSAANQKVTVTSTHAQIMHLWVNGKYQSGNGGTYPVTLAAGKNIITAEAVNRNDGKRALVHYYVTYSNSSSAS